MWRVTGIQRPVELKQDEGHTLGRYWYYYFFELLCGKASEEDTYDVEVTPLSCRRTPLNPARLCGLFHI